MLALALLLASVTVGFGAVDLLSPWILHEGTQVSDVGYGTLAGLVLPVGLAAQLGAAGSRRVGRRVLAAAALAYLMAGFLAGEWPLVAAAAAVGVALAVLVALRPAHDVPQVLRRRASLPLLALALAAAAPGSVYAVQMALNERHGVLPSDAHLGLQHWAALAAAALATVFTGLLAGVEREGFTLPALTAGSAVLLWAVTCLIYPDSAGAPGRSWAVVAIGWAMLFALATFWGAGAARQARASAGRRTAASGRCWAVRRRARARQRHSSGPPSRRCR